MNLERLNTTETRAILAGVAMAGGLQLSGDFFVDLAIVGSFVIGGLVDLVQRIRRKRQKRNENNEQSSALETVLVLFCVFLLGGCGVPVVTDQETFMGTILVIKDATLTGEGVVSGTVGNIPFELVVTSKCSDDSEPVCDAMVCVTVLGLTRCETTIGVE